LPDHLVKYAKLFFYNHKRCVCPRNFEPYVLVSSYIMCAGPHQGDMQNMRSQNRPRHC